MAKFCRNCGNQLADDALFCASCGSKVEVDNNAAPQNVVEEQASSQIPEAAADDNCAACDCTECSGTEATEENANENEGGISGAINNFIGKLKNKDKNTLIITSAALGVIIILLVVVCIFGSSSGGPEAAVGNYVNVCLRGESEDVDKLFPEVYLEFLEDEYDIEIEDLEKSAKSASKLAVKSFEEAFGDDLEIEYDVLDVYELSNKKLDGIKDGLKENYDIPKKLVEEAVEMEVEMTIEGDKDRDSNEDTLYAVNIDGDWFMCELSGTLTGAEEIAELAIFSVGDIAGELMDELGDLLG